MQTSESLLRTWDLMLFQISMKATSDIFKADSVWNSMDIYSGNNRTQTHRNIYFLRYFSLTTCLPSRQWEKLSWTQLYFPSSSEMGEKKRGWKKGTSEKRKWLWLSKGLSTSLKVSFRVFEGTEGVGGRGLLLLALSLPPSLKMNPIEWERWGDRETARNKALTSLKQMPFCMTTNTYLGEKTAGNLREDPKMPSPFSSHTPNTQCSFTCRTLRATPPLLARIRSNR